MIPPVTHGSGLGSTQTVAEYAAALARSFPSKAGGKTYLDLAPMYGRPPLTAAETAAINTGGAW